MLVPAISSTTAMLFGRRSEIVQLIVKSLIDPVSRFFLCTGCITCIIIISYCLYSIAKPLHYIATCSKSCLPARICSQHGSKYHWFGIEHAVFMPECNSVAIVSSLANCNITNRRNSNNVTKLISNRVLQFQW